MDCPHSTPKWSDAGEICIRTTNFRPGFLDLTQVKYVSKETYESRIARLKPEPGDVVYSREGGILGIACSIPDDTTLCLGQRMMLMRTWKGLVEGDYLTMILNSPQILTIVQRLTGGSASPHLNVGDIKAFPIPLPPVEEQRVILTQTKALLGFGSRVSGIATECTNDLTTLTQSVLAKAFRGELVPQDPNDEPASLLLARLRQQREAEAATKKKPKRKAARKKGITAA